MTLIDYPLNDAGTKVNKIVWPDESYVEVGDNGVRSLTVSLVAGQGAYVPWIKMVREMPDGMVKTWIYNSAMIEAIELLEE